MRRSVCAAAICLVLLPPGTDGQESPTVQIELVNGTEAEARMAEELRMVLETYDLDPWILTRKVQIDEDAIPHSHPVLTLHTRHLGDEANLLTAFLHEQLHWLEDKRSEAWDAAEMDFREFYPEVPASSEGGARDDESTYLHLLVCDLEYQAMTALVGEEAARETLSKITHYEWIYDRVLNEPRVRAVALRHGFDVTKGVRQP